MNRIPEDEVPQVYADFEVAGHGFRHEFLADLNKETMSESIDKDIDKLSIIFQRDILEFAYPYGSISDTVVSKLKTKGILYARTVTSSKGFKLPKDPLRWNPTCPMIGNFLHQIKRAKKGRKPLIYKDLRPFLFYTSTAYIFHLAIFYWPLVLRMIPAIDFGVVNS